MNVPVRMPRIAAAGIRIRVDSVAVEAGAAVRAGDQLMALRVGDLPATLHAEVSGVVKDIRVQACGEVLAERVVCWVESQELPPLRWVGVTAAQPSAEAQPEPGRVTFHLPAELLGSCTPVVHQVRVQAGQSIGPDVPLLDVALGSVRFAWSAGFQGAIAEVLVKAEDPLPDGIAVARLAGAPHNAPVTNAQLSGSIPAPRRDTEIPELSLAEFRQAMQMLREKVLAMAELVSTAGLANSTDLLRAEAAKLADPHFSVAVVGEFKRGKSTFLNALAGGEFLPNDVVPCTAFACRFQYGEQLQLAFVGADGSETLSPLRTREEIGAELDRLTRDPNTTIREAIIRLPLSLCREGVDLIDTPGLNDSEAMNRVTLGVLPNVDAAILLLIPESPLSETERRFLQDHLLGHDVSRIVLVLNAKDRVPPPKLPRLLEYLRTQIDRILAERQAAQAPLYSVSAKGELQDPGGAGTGFVELRQHLSLLLFRQRGRLILSQTLQRTGRASSEALASIKLRLAQLTISRESFDASLNEVNRQLATTRLHANEIRRRLGEAQMQANAAATAQAAFLSLALLALRESLPRTISADLLKGKTTDQVKVQLSSLLQQEAGKLYQQTLTKLMASLVAIYEPVSRAARSFAGQAESAFTGLAGNVYQSAVGVSAVATRATGRLEGFEQVDMSGGFAIHVDLSLGAMSWLLLVESTRDLLAIAGLAGSLDAHAVARLREDYGREIERQVRAKANERFLTARFFEIARRPFDNLLESFNQEMKVLLDDTNSTLASLRSTAAGQGSAQGRQWQDLHGRIESLLAECESVVFADRGQSLPAAP